MTAFAIYRVDGKSKRVLDVADAAEMAMNGSLNRDGELERMNERMDNHARFVGALVDRLVDAGALSRDAIEHLLGFDYRLVVVDTKDETE